MFCTVSKKGEDILPSCNVTIHQPVQDEITNIYIQIACQFTITVPANWMHPLNFKQRYTLSQHDRSRNFSKCGGGGGGGGGAIGQNFTIHLTYKIYSSAMLYSKGSKSWYTYFQTIIQIYIKRRKLYGQHIWFWAHSFPYMTQGWNYSHMWCDQIVSGLIIK